MLRVVQQKSAAAAKSYYAAADYYSEGRELVGSWGGKGTERLGLSGQVAKTEFDRLCENRHPATGGPLTVRTKGERTVGYDFTWSVSKSVSALYALTNDEELLRAFQTAVDATMQDIEAEMKTRVRAGGEVAERTTGNGVWASFYHFTSRPVDGIPDPQMHAHCFVFNSTWDENESRWKAGQFRDLKKDAPFWQSAFRSRLAELLQVQGYKLDIKNGDFEIAGIPASVIEKFSRRTAKIEKVAKDKGITDPDRKAELGATTRAKKDTTLSWEELRRAWDASLTPEERQAVLDTHAGREPDALSESRAVQAVDYALDHCFERESVVDEKVLYTEALRRGLGAVTVDDVATEFKRRPLLVREREGRRLATLPAVLAEEDGLVETVRAGRGTCAPLVGRHHPISRDWLGGAQRRAVKHLWESPDRYLFIRGAAGVGKTTLLQEAKEGIEAAGHRIVALAPTAAASRGVLRKEGFASADTLSRFLVDEKMQEQARGQVVMLDEAGLVGGRAMASLVEKIEQLDARLVLVGDVRQHRAAGAYGSPLRLLEEQAGVPVVEVAEIRRQTGSYRKAVELMRDGKAEEGLAQLDALGWVKEVAEDERYRALAADYLQVIGTTKKGGVATTALIVTPTHREAGLVTAAVREGLRAKGKLGPERDFAVWEPVHLTEAERRDDGNVRPGDMLQFHKHAPGHAAGSRTIVGEGTPPLAHADRFQVYRPATIPVAAGDVLRVTANGKTKDGRHRLDNGALLKVKGFTDQGDILTDSHWVIARDWGHLAHGFAVTSHAAQGKTVDHVLIAQSALSHGASSREQLYVSTSRGKSRAVIYCDDKGELGEAVRRSESRLTATELVGHRQGWRKRWRKHWEALKRRAPLGQPHDGHGGERSHGREQVRGVGHGR